MKIQKNIFGDDLIPCCLEPITGFFRDGYCNTNINDHGIHTVCVLLTSEFLEFSKKQGNDLSTPNPQFNFPGLKDGDFWCLCAGRWLDAYRAGCAPKIKLEATNEETLAIIPLSILQEFTI